mmetsp:Transcript_29081/g.45580  ORF Transcript_29081/g.45580 Transcript_29081/m.45580 type:complete len:88 (+) Transcript_29081:603-866(+)
MWEMLINEKSPSAPRPRGSFFAILRGPAPRRLGLSVCSAPQLVQILGVSGVGSAPGFQLLRSSAPQPFSSSVPRPLNCGVPSPLRNP